MSDEETLYTAARRAVRYFNITMQHGGLVDVHLESAMETLNKYVKLEELLRKQQEQDEH